MATPTREELSASLQKIQAHLGRGTFHVDKSGTFLSELGTFLSAVGTFLDYPQRCDPTNNERKRRHRAKCRAKGVERSPFVSLSSESDPSLKEEEKEAALEVWEHYSEARGKPGAPTPHELAIIVARLAEGFSVRNLCQSIDGIEHDTWELRPTRDALGMVFKDGERVRYFLSCLKAYEISLSKLEGHYGPAKEHRILSPLEMPFDPEAFTRSAGFEIPADPTGSVRAPREATLHYEAREA